MFANGLDGIAISSASNTIGGTAVNTGNWICNNESAGVDIFGASSFSNFLGLNTIGTDPITGVQGNGRSGVHVTNTSSNTIGAADGSARNTIGNNGTWGIDVDNASSTSVLGNYIGTNGTAAWGNGSDGIAVHFGSTLTFISNNVISGNSLNGVLIGGSSDTNTSENVLQGNTIGLNAAGNAPLGNKSNGIAIVDSSLNVIGSAGNLPNVISGNQQDGILISGASAVVDSVIGNYIGTDATGKISLGNGENGVELSGGSNEDYVGGSTTGDGNVISGNLWNGIYLNYANNNWIQGNYIGTDMTGAAVLQGSNQNVPSGNGRNGIDVLMSSGNVIGGAVNGDGDSVGPGLPGNVISNNGNLNGTSPPQRNGVFLEGSGTTNKAIQGNYYLGP